MSTLTRQEFRIKAESPESAAKYAEGGRRESNRRVVALATGSEFDGQFQEGQHLYQEYKKTKTEITDNQTVVEKVEKNEFKLREQFEIPDRSSSSLESEVEGLKKNENESAKTMAVQLGLVYQAISERDIETAIMVLDKQGEIFDSLEATAQFLGKMSDILDLETSLGEHLPKLKESLEKVEAWDVDRKCGMPASEEMERLLHYVYLEKGMTVWNELGKGENINSSQVVKEISERFIRPMDEVSSDGSDEVSKFLNRTANDWQKKAADGEMTTEDLLAKDNLLAGKLLKKIIDSPEIFNKLNPRVQKEMETALDGYCLAAEISVEDLIVEEPMVKVKEISEPVTESMEAAPEMPEKVDPLVSTIQEDARVLMRLGDGPRALIVAAGGGAEYTSPEIVNLAQMAVEKYAGFKENLPKPTKNSKWNFFAKARYPQEQIDTYRDLRREYEESDEFLNGDRDKAAKVVGLEYVIKEMEMFNNQK